MSTMMFTDDSITAVQVNVDNVGRKVWWEETLPSGAQVWVARDLDLPGCIVQEGSAPAALAALEDARLHYRAVMAEIAQPSDAPDALLPTSTSETSSAIPTKLFSYRDLQPVG